MTMYVRSAACLSAAFPLEGGAEAVRTAIAERWSQAAVQHVENSLLLSRKAGGPRLAAIEPDYNTFIDPKMIRRMSRIVKMGVSAAMHCLKTGGDPVPGALITGTAFGCLEDTSIFLRRMIANNEEMLSPTAFIQSTHNTVGAQVALLLKCHSYNNTIVHRAFSLEHSLTEAGMLLAEGMGPVLVGAVDEITDDSFALLQRFGLFRDAGSRRYPAGEGAAFFLLQAAPSGGDLARIDHVATLFQPGINASESLSWITEELGRAGIDPGSIGIILDGSAGLFGAANATAFSDAGCVAYKSLCGEFPTAPGFALWLAAVLAFGSGNAEAVRRLMLYNASPDGHHSLILVSPC